MLWRVLSKVLSATWFNGYSKIEEKKLRKRRLTSSSQLDGCKNPKFLQIANDAKIKKWLLKRIKSRALPGKCDLMMKPRV